MAKLPFGIVTKKDRNYVPVDRHLVEDLIDAAKDLLADPKDPENIRFYKAAEKEASKWVTNHPESYPLADKLLAGRPFSFRRKTIAAYLAEQTVKGLEAKLDGHAERRRARVMARTGMDAHA